ncbi:MAG: DNA-binding LytR/AlgR family response regulator, partial [Bacteroidia bacterium]
MEGLQYTGYLIRSEAGKELVKKSDIIMLKGNGASVGFYIFDHTKPEGFRITTVGKHLKSFEGSISPDFVRMNQSHIVNLNYWLKLMKQHTLLLKVPTNYKLQITRTYRSSVYKY